LAYWLMKTEPEEFSFADLERVGQEPWNGVRNNAALKHMRAMVKGDQFLFYHTGNERSIVGVGRVVREAYPDPQGGTERFVVVDVAPEYRFAHPVTLAAVKAEGTFADWELVRQSRLSVMPVSSEQWQRLHEMGQTTA
jgi:predicted RNA-binding protein with PUA-like domain